METWMQMVPAATAIILLGIGVLKRRRFLFLSSFVPVSLQQPASLF
jgi:hypothetical protein